MAHYAEVVDGTATRVLVTDNTDENTEGVDSIIADLVETFGGEWVKTSYNGTIRHKYAGVGDTFDPVNDVFISPQPYPSWSLDEGFDWQPPTPIPDDGEVYIWDETTLSWVESAIS